jgi:hypothetical protein
MNETRSIKIKMSTYRVLKVLAAQSDEKLMELVDRLAAEEERKRTASKPPIDSRLDSHRDPQR